MREEIKRMRIESETSVSHKEETLSMAWTILWILLALALWNIPTKGQSQSANNISTASPHLRVSASQQISASQSINGVDAVGITVSDMDKAVEFYTKVLSFEKVSDVEVAGESYEQLQGVFGLRMRVVRLKLGSEFIELTDYLAPEGKPVPVDSRSNDRWFQHFAIIVSDMDKAYAWLRQNKVQHASTSPQRLPDWNKNAGGIKAFYFKDPDGHALEILSFPPDKGLPKWHDLAKSGKIFLGIDHTAIVVSNTEESLKFYRDTLGLEVKGKSENYGTEQEHLNNVFGARLHITGLRPASDGNGIGIEFLEYLSPRDGRPYPMDAKANDLIHWQTNLKTNDSMFLMKMLLAGKYNFISSGLVTMPDNSFGFKQGFMVRDPDGHAMRIIQ